MQARTRLILTSTLTFCAGLLTGATVLSDVLRDEPAAEPVPVEQPVTAQPEPPPEEMVKVQSVSVVDPEPPAPVEPAPEPPPEPPAPPPPGVSPEVTDALQARIDELTDGWGRMQAELAELRQRVVLVERREPEPAAEPESTGRRNRPATPEEQRNALLGVGVAAEVADDIVWRNAQVSLARLDLYDEASRNGWAGTSRYRDELRRINEQRVSVEDEIGTDAYDRYLYQTGQPNRVAVDSVLPGSVGEESGLLPGDIIERYGDKNVLDYQDLRTATSAGERGEPVSVTVVRDGQPLEVVVPRGPIGIGLEATRLEPAR